MDKGLAARRAAVALLLEVVDKGRLMAEAVADEQGPLNGLSGPDRARAQRLALETLRRAESIDFLLAEYISREPNAQSLAILRLAVTELLERPSEAHGIVSAAVDLAREGRYTAQAAGFMNAVLRKIAQKPRQIPTQKLPVWLRSPLVRRFGKVVVKAIEEAHLAGPMLDITVKDQSKAEEWATKLEGKLLPTGSIRLSTGVQVSTLPGYTEGEWWVQDAAAAIPAKVLNVQKGERVLDMCAAPGGKTMQLAAAGAKVIAIDTSASRMERVRENLARTSLEAELVVGDSLEFHAAPRFDAILLDAPCSATGTIRRHPDLPFVKSQSDMKDLLRLQSAMIDKAIELLAPGGRLVFCTCSLLPEEGEEQMAAALARHKDMSRDQKAVQGFPGNWDAKGGGLRIRPDHWQEEGGIDGFFVGAMRKSE